MGPWVRALVGVVGVSRWCEGRPGHGRQACRAWPGHTGPVAGCGSSARVAPWERHGAVGAIQTAGRRPRDAAGGLRPSAPVAARWARIVWMTLGWVMKAMMRIGPPQRGQASGSTS